MEEAARKPGKVDAQRRRRRRRAGRRAKQHRGRVLHARTSPTRRWSRRPPSRASRTARRRSGRRVQSPQAAQDLVAKRLGLKLDDVTVQRHAARRRLRPQVQARLRASRRRCCPRRWTASRSRWCGRARTISSTATSTPSSVERIEAGLDAAGKPVAWLHRSAAPTILSLFAPDPKHQFAARARHGSRRHAVRRSQHPHRERRGRRRTRASAGSARSPTSRTRSRCSRSSAELAATAGKDPKDFLLEVIGPDRKIEPGDDRALVELRREPRALPDRHRRACGRSSKW